MDAEKYLALRPAPRALFDAPERRNLVRFRVPEGAAYRDVTFGEVTDEVRDIALFLKADGHREGDRGAVGGNPGGAYPSGPVQAYTKTVRCDVWVR